MTSLSLACAGATADRKIKFYRNPMGWPITRHPRRIRWDDYIPVYEGETPTMAGNFPGKNPATGVNPIPQLASDPYGDPGARTFNSTSAASRHFHAIGKLDPEDRHVHRHRGQQRHP